ncbi:hypothetical protein KSZ_49490 [Dictyobacter formicarum]|uniref:Uncharacterized protein n=1 Tax=Dictyobacter formicarum TaxID=2778368 RepID=A0ABQ3VNJ2_9CHLR|nr:hypothetical protein KSZ_49490 [Dictyobacter formicarum]
MDGSYLLEVGLPRQIFWEVLVTLSGPDVRGGKIAGSQGKSGLFQQDFSPNLRQEAKPTCLKCYESLQGRHRESGMFAVATLPPDEVSIKST